MLEYVITATRIDAHGRTVKTRTEAYRELFRHHSESELVGQIRKSVNQGMALGNDRFTAEVEPLTGRRANVLQRGPKPKV